MIPQPRGTVGPLRNRYGHATTGLDPLAPAVHISTSLGPAWTSSNNALLVDNVVHVDMKLALYSAVGQSSERYAARALHAC